MNEQINTDTVVDTITNAINWDGVQVRLVFGNVYGVWLPLADESRFADAAQAVRELDYPIKSAGIVGEWPGLYGEFFLEVQS